MIYIDLKNTVTFYDAPETVERSIHNLLMCRDDTEVGMGYDGELTRPAYQDGLNDGWECAKKIYSAPSDGGYTLEQLTQVFGEDSMSAIARTHTASAAIAKIKAYEEEKKAEAEIKVGDEVYFSDENHTRVVFSIFYENAKEPRVLQFTESGNYVVDNISDLHKTGRHFSQIEEVLKQMKGK